METRFEKGWRMLREIDGEAGETVIQSLRDIAPDFGKYIIEFVFGDIYPRPYLELKQRELIVIASLAALGGCEPQLKVHVGAGLNVGLTPNEIIEALIHTSAYAGFPRTLNSILAAGSVFAQKDVNPVWTNPINIGDRHTIGWRLLERLDSSAAMKVQASLKEVAPDLGNYVIEYAYGDIYSRQGLNIKEHQLVTISIITTLGGAESQLKFHIEAALNIGLTPNEIVETIMNNVWVNGFPRTLNALEATKSIFDERDVKPSW